MGAYGLTVAAAFASSARGCCWSKSPYVTKLGAYGLTVAAAFAVALAVLLSVSTTQTAEAATATNGAALPAAGVAGGTKVYTTAVSGQLATFVIIQDDSTATGKFTHGTAVNSGQRVTCNDNADCDKNDDIGSIQVEVQVDADSANGNIIIAVTAINDNASTTTADFVRVKQAPVPTTLTVQAGREDDRCRDRQHHRQHQADGRERRRALPALA